MIIRTLITIVLSLLLTEVSLIGQTEKKIKCKYEKNEIDDFTKNKIVLTKDKELFSKTPLLESYTSILTVSGYSTNGENSLFFNYEGHDAPSYIVDRYFKIDLLLENDEVISLHDGEGSDWQKIGIWDYNYKYYKIDSVHWQKLKNISLKKIRIHIHHDKTQATLDISKKNKDIIQEVIYCVENAETPKAKKD